MKQQSWELPVDTSVLYLAFSASSMEKGQFCVVCVCMVGVCLCEVCVCVSVRVRVNPNLILGKESRKKSLPLVKRDFIKIML